MSENYEISLKDWKEMEQESCLLLDVRDNMAFQYGHIGDAINLPLEELKEQIEKNELSEQLKQNKKIIVYCKRGEASAEATALLREQGCDAYNLTGGYMAWLLADTEQGSDDEKGDTEKDRLADIEQSIRKKFHKQLFTRFAKALNTYDMLKEGDKVAVCISGGKDSMLMAKLFQELKRHNKFSFDLVFLVMDPGYNAENRKVIENNARLLNIPITIFETNIFEAVYEIEKSPCYLCARMRRGYLYSKAKELGCNKIALGHHFDDVIETTLMSMLWGAEVKTMMPKLHSTNYPGMELIRPLYLVRETDILAWKRYNGLTFLQCACRFTEQEADEGMHGARSETKALIAALRKTNPQADVNIFRSMHHVNLNMALGWTQDGQLRSFLDGYETQRTAAGGGPENE